MITHRLPGDFYPMITYTGSVQRTIGGIVFPIRVVVELWATLDAKSAGTMDRVGVCASPCLSPPIFIMFN